MTEADVVVAAHQEDEVDHEVDEVGEPKAAQRRSLYKFPPNR